MLCLRRREIERPAGGRGLVGGAMERPREPPEVSGRHVVPRLMSPCRVAPGPLVEAVGVVGVAARSEEAGVPPLERSPGACRCRAPALARVLAGVGPEVGLDAVELTHELGRWHRVAELRRLLAA